MARKRSDEFVKGLSVSDILRMSSTQFDAFTPQQQRIVTSRLASAANKRIKTFTSKGETSPAVEEAMETGGKFSVAGKSGEAIEKEFERARLFLRQKISSRREWKKVEKLIGERLEARTGIKIAPDKLAEVMSIINYASHNGMNLTRSERYTLMKKYADDEEFGKFDSIDDILTWLRTSSDLYKQSQDDRINDIGTSRFYTVK